MWMKIDLAYEKMSTKTRFEKEAWGNSEMAYFVDKLRWLSWKQMTLCRKKIKNVLGISYE